MLSVLKRIQSWLRPTNPAGESSDDSPANAALRMLFAKPPTERLIIPHKEPTYPVVHVARWPSAQFESHDSFIELTETYDTAMQGYIQGMSRSELSEWFVPHHECDPSAIAGDITVKRTEDAVDWVERTLPFVSIPWLHREDHTEIIWEAEGEFGELIAFGDAGYFYLFVADLL